METQNLWPDFPTEEIKGPKSILKEQAGYLAAKTNNVLIADVETSQFKENMIYSFYVVAPVLGNYRYKLFSIAHVASSYFPLYIDWRDDTSTERECRNKNELTAYLKHIFNDAETIKVVSSLISQSLAEKADQPF